MVWGYCRYVSPGKAKRMFAIWGTDNYGYEVILKRRSEIMLSQGSRNDFPER